MNRELSWDIIHTDRAWHELEQQLAADAKAAGTPEKRLTDIVDIDVLPERGTTLEFSDRNEVREAYERVLADPRLEDNSSQEFIRRRVTAQLAHLDVLEGVQCNRIDHIETTMGSALTLIHEPELDRWQTQLEERLRRHGLGFDRSYAENFQERLGVETGRKAMRRHVTTFVERTGVLAEGEDPSASLAVPEIVEVDESWAGFCSTRENGELFTQLNAHKRHGYTRGRAAAVSAHEANGHAQDFAQKREAILDGKMDPLFGVTIVFGPENVPAEMIAQGREQQILRSVRGEDAWEYQFQAEYHDYAEAVWNNALILINSGFQEKTVTEYLQNRLLPYEKLENIQGRLRDSRDDPAWRANYGAYEPALRIVREVLKLSPEQQEDFFQEVGRYPYDEAQMRAMLGQTATTLTTA